MDNPNIELKQKCRELIKLMNEGCLLAQLMVKVYEINEISEEAIEYNKKELIKTEKETKIVKKPFMSKNSPSTMYGAVKNE